MANLKNTTINDTGFLEIPSGTTAQRPSSPEVGMLRYNTSLELAEIYDGAEWKNLVQLPLGTADNPAPSAQAIIDENPNVTSGVYTIDVPNIGPKQCYCEFIDGYGFIVVANTNMAFRNTLRWAWNDTDNWLDNGDDFGDVNNPYNPSSPQYRNKDAWINYPGTRVGIKIHNDGTMFGSGSYVFFDLLSSQNNKSWQQLMNNPGGLGGGTQITQPYFAEAGVDTAGSGTSTSGHLSPDLDFCTIARTMGPSGHLRVNHTGGNNGARILGSEQILETSNTDSTRGIACAYAMSPNNDIRAQDSGWNVPGSAPLTDSPSVGSNQGRMYPPDVLNPNSSNSSAQGDAANFPGSPPEYSYAILIN